MFHSTKWQRVEQFVEPVVFPVVDVRVVTQVLTQRYRVAGIPGVEVRRTGQRLQNDQTLLSICCDVVIQRRVELL